MEIRRSCHDKIAPTECDVDPESDGGAEARFVSDRQDEVGAEDEDPRKNDRDTTARDGSPSLRRGQVGQTERGRRARAVVPRLGTAPARSGPTSRSVGMGRRYRADERANRLQRAAMRRAPRLVQTRSGRCGSTR